jgi:hypothetical protein
MGIAVQIAIGLKELVARDIGQEEMPIIENAYKTRLTPFRRGIAVAFSVAGGHDDKR